MTTPVTEDDLVQGAVKYLLDVNSVLTHLGTTDSGTPWLFQHSLFTVVEGSSMAAAVLGYAGAWAGANEYNHLRFPRLSVELWVDPLRDINGDITEPGETHRRAQVIWTAFDKALHRTRGPEQWWGAVRVISSHRQTEPSLYVVPDGRGMVRSLSFYAIEMG